MQPPPRVLIAQINPTVGRIHDNAAEILAIIQAHAHQQDIILFPELALSGYPPEDWLFKDAFHQQIDYQLNQIQQATPACHVIVGHPERHHTGIYNAASVFYQGKKLAHYHKQCLPNTGVFDECRYFLPGEPRACVFTRHGVRFGVAICEDLWHPEPIHLLKQADVHCLLALNASPFDLTKYEQRISVLHKIARQHIAIVYANLVGGQDELLFDGRSLMMDNTGQIVTEGPAFETALIACGVNSVVPRATETQLLYQALVTATKDYITKNNATSAIVGLSGGIDSALTLAIAADALGAENVTAVRLPSRYTADMSLEDAALEIEALGVKSETFSIEPAYQALLDSLSPTVSATGLPAENLQARVRGTMLMALSNQTGALLLNTSNKSELAMGYGTLYGDMAGAFSVLKDVYKTQVYALARYRNAVSPVMPERVLTRPPSAELAPNQTDQDTLPPYDLLDGILQAYIEQNATIRELLAAGFTAKDVHFVLERLHRQEYKRAQAPLGPKVSVCGFGKDWRFPVSGHL